MQTSALMLCMGVVKCALRISVAANFTSDVLDMACINAEAAKTTELQWDNFGKDKVSLLCRCTIGDRELT